MAASIGASPKSGIEIDRNLNMKGKFKYLYKIVDHKICLLKTVRPCLTIKAALDVDRSMILILIDYGNVSLTGCTQSDKSDLETLQYKILRCCLRTEDHQDIIGMHYVLDLSFVDQQQHITLLTHVKICVLENKYPLVDHGKLTRQINDLKINFQFNETNM